jgi:hypothetical protein
MSKKDMQVDSQGRVNLTGLRKKEDASWYFGYRDPDGTIRLVPAVLVPAKLKTAAEEGPDVLRAELPRDVLTQIREKMPSREEVHDGT